MYSTCLFCHSKLGTNESVEHFPIGRRLAFDAARGRLWVVCRNCERWNLSPLEERWEAIEECERLFSATRTRVSTDNIGLARVREGLELVRIGLPQRPEMAAWRYGDQFGRRYRKQLLWMGLGLVGAAGFTVIGPMAGVITAAGGLATWNLASTSHTIYQARKSRARVRVPDNSSPVTLRKMHLTKVAILGRADRLALEVPFDTTTGLSSRKPKFFGQHGSSIVEGKEAVRIAGQILPAINENGARRSQVADAVRLIEEHPDSEMLFRQYTKPHVATPGKRPLGTLPTAVRLALEMAAHEESERRALEGELALLEAAWQDAEEIAAIADDMFVPDETRARLSDLKADS